GAGDCVAGGTSWVDGGQAIVVSEEAGVWGTATEVPGIAALNVGSRAAVDSGSCAGVGGCAAAGYYGAPYKALLDPRGFVVSEHGGVWGQARPVPTAPVFTPGSGRPVSTVNSVSCGGVGECVAGGSYYLRGLNTRWRWAFLAVERNGAWDR